MPSLRLAILRADDHHHRYLESTLRASFDVTFCAVEPGAATVRRLRQKGRHRDYAYAKYHDLRRRITGKDRYRRRYFQHVPDLSGGDGTIVVESINSPEVIAGLTSARPDVTVVIGCSILRTAVLDAAGPRVVNLHGGFLPDYRGNHCLFFALYHDEPDKTGVSIHHVDPQVDTGPLIQVVRPPRHGGETAEHLYCRAEKLAIHRLAGLLDRLAAGAELPSSPQPARGRTFRTRDRGPSHELRMWARQRAWPGRRGRTRNAG